MTSNISRSKDEVIGADFDSMRQTYLSTIQYSRRIAECSDRFSFRRRICVERLPEFSNKKVVIVMNLNAGS